MVLVLVLVVLVLVLVLVVVSCNVMGWNVKEVLDLHQSINQYINQSEL